VSGLALWLIKPTAQQAGEACSQRHD